MQFLPEEIMNSLQRKFIIDFAGEKENIDIITRNVWIQELKKPEKYRRTFCMCENHVRTGYGSELCILSTKMFKAGAPIVENANENISYINRKIDMTTLNGKIKIEIKSFSNKYDLLHISDSQKKSIEKSSSINDLLITVRYNLLDSYNKIEYTPEYIIDMKKIADYIVPYKSMYSNHILVAKKAVKDGFGIRIQDYD